MPEFNVDPSAPDELELTGIAVRALHNAFVRFESTKQDPALFDVMIERVSDTELSVVFLARPIPGRRPGLGNANRQGSSVVYSVSLSSGEVLSERGIR